MTRDNVLYLVIAVLAVAVVVRGLELYEARKHGGHVILREKSLSIDVK